MKENCNNSKKYIGQTTRPRERWWEHCKTNKKDLQPINKAINKYGKDKFKFKIIHKDIPAPKLNNWEVYYINEVYNTYKGYGYNIHLGGGFFLRGEKSFSYKRSKNSLSKKEAIKLIKFHNKNPNYSRRQLAKRFKTTASIVGEILRKEHWTIRDLNIDISDEIRPGDGKVTKETGIKIYNEYKNNKKITQKQLANKYNLGTKTIFYIVNGKHWTTQKLPKTKKYRKTTIKESLKVLNLRNKGLTYKQIKKKSFLCERTINLICLGEHSITPKIKQVLINNLINTTKRYIQTSKSNIDYYFDKTFN